MSIIASTVSAITEQPTAAQNLEPQLGIQPTYSCAGLRSSLSKKLIHKPTSQQYSRHDIYTQLSAQFVPNTLLHCVHLAVKPT